MAVFFPGWRFNADLPREAKPVQMQTCWESPPPRPPTGTYFMSSTRHFLIVLLLLGGTTAFAAVKNLVVVDFTYMPRNPDGTRERGYEYGFGDWDDKKKVTQIPDKGLLANLVGSKGGVGENRGLDFRKHTLARLNFIIGNRNQAESFGFSLVDKDGTDHSWDITLKGQPRGVALNPLIDLTKPGREDKPGKTPGLDLKKLKVWQIKGNYQDAAIEVMFVKVTAVSD